MRSLESHDATARWLAAGEKARAATVSEGPSASSMSGLEGTIREAIG
jgi:hypothetical protein